MRLKHVTVGYARNELVLAAVQFELACAANKKNNTRENEQVVDNALAWLGVATRRYIRLIRKKRA